MTLAWTLSRLAKPFTGSTKTLPAPNSRASRKPNGWVVVIWNERLTDTTPFLRDYESLLRQFGTDYATVKESYPSEQHMRDFFGAAAYSSHTLPNFQEFDFDGVAGRLAGAVRLSPHKTTRISRP